MPGFPLAKKAMLAPAGRYNKRRMNIFTSRVCSTAQPLPCLGISAHLLLIIQSMAYYSINVNSLLKEYSQLETNYIIILVKITCYTRNKYYNTVKQLVRRFVVSGKTISFGAKLLILKRNRAGFPMFEFQLE